MIRLGLRLALASGREAVARLTVIALAVAVGVGLLLAVLAGLNAVNTQNARYAWMNTGLAKNPANAGPAAKDPALWFPRIDYFHGKSLDRLDVAITGPDGPVPPGIPRLPGPGEYYVSPELAEQIRDNPAGELGDRFPGRPIGTIGASALPAPDTLLIVIGHRPDELANLPDVRRVTRIETVDPNGCDGCYSGINTDGIDLILSVVTAGLLFPLLMFIGTATRLAAARREQRFAAMRLVGATPRQISVISAVESTVAAVAGTLVGFGVFFAIRPGLAAIPFTGAPFFPSDLVLHAWNVLLVTVGVPVGAAAAARLALRRVQISPLGVSRRVTPRPPRAWRAIPLLIGLGEMAFLIGRRPHTTNGQIQGYLSGIFLIMGGLVIAGPWLTMIGARVLARRASRPAMLIAGRRLADNPKAGFRAVSGLMLALFVTAVATGVITTIVADRGSPRTGSVAGSALTQSFWQESRQPQPVPAAIPDRLGSVPGVRSVLVVRKNPLDKEGVFTGALPGVISCADLARDPQFGRCATGAQVAGVFPNLLGPRSGHTAPSAMVWESAGVDPAALSGLPMLAVVVNTDGSAPAIERARTLLENAFPGRDLPSTEGEFESDLTQTLVQWQQLANVVILASLPIAGCSLAVSVVGGLSERKRPFSMLRLTGVRLGLLQRVITLESAAPLLIVAVLATAMGFLTAHLFLRAQLDYTLRPPGLAYYLIVAAGLLASLGIIASTLPLLRRITGPETARNE